MGGGKDKLLPVGLVGSQKKSKQVGGQALEKESTQIQSI